MARVRVHGQEYMLPEGETFTVQAVEMEDPSKQVLYQYLFRPGDPRVQWSKQVREVGWSEGPGAVAYPEWERQPDKHINEFLLLEDYPAGGIEPPHWSSRGLYHEQLLKDKPPGMKKSAKKKASRSPIGTGYLTPFEDVVLRERAAFQKEMKRRQLPGYEDSGADIEKFLGNPTLEMEAREMDGENKWRTGDRLFFICPVDGEEKRGTLVGRPPEMRGKTGPGSYLVCSDSANRHYTHLTEYTGEHHGIFIQVRHMRRAEEPDWSGVPPHIALYVGRSFEFDNVKFSSGRTGRMLRYSETGDQVLVSWEFRSAHFSSDHDDRGIEHDRTYYVPTETLRWCNTAARSEKTGKRKPKPWPAANIRPAQRTREVGDICVVKPRSVSCIDKRDKETTLPGGTVVKLVKNNGGGSRDRSWTCEILGNCDDNLIGVSLNIQNRYMTMHPDPEGLYFPGQRVEIVAQVDFRKKPLQGMQGKVILMTDPDGDVGIEFPDDIGAGSLDGIGKEGHCIYIEAQAVKASE